MFPKYNLSNFLSSQPLQNQLLPTVIFAYEPKEATKEVVAACTYCINSPILLLSPNSNTKAVSPQPSIPATQQDRSSKPRPTMQKALRSLYP